MHWYANIKILKAQERNLAAVRFEPTQFGLFQFKDPDRFHYTT